MTGRWTHLYLTHQAAWKKSNHAFIFLTSTPANITYTHWMSTLIEVRNLTRQFGDYCAVDDVSFSLDKGEVLGFLGPNGAGKSTTMKMICGNLTPTVGEIKINGYDIIEQPKLAKSRIRFFARNSTLVSRFNRQWIFDVLCKTARIEKRPLFKKSPLE